MSGEFVNCFTTGPVLLTICCFFSAAITAARQELLKGFAASPDSSVSSFQPLLSDPTGNFSLGFLRVKQTQLALAVLHNPSSEPLWLANPTTPARWSSSTRVFFNGSLVIADRRSGVFWSTDTDGDLVTLLENSDLQIHGGDGPPDILWRSFYFPTDTLVENQNLTSAMALVSSNSLYSMRLGEDFIGLYAKFSTKSEHLYWKHNALEAKAKIVEGQGPINVRVDSDGYLGMYQNGTVPVDVQAFSSFNRDMNGFLRIRLEPDGNLRGYYWDGPVWALNYEAIQSQCELPSACGGYGLCGSGGECSCLDNRTEFTPGGCGPVQSGDFCAGGRVAANGFRSLRRKGVELAHKEWVQFEVAASLEECEGICESNCTCWGALYNNGSGSCYTFDYPAQTLIGVADEGKAGYFKVRKGAGERAGTEFRIWIGVFFGGFFVFVGAVGFGSYRYWRRKRSRVLRNRLSLEEDESGVSPSPGRYKKLGSGSSKSVQLTCTKN